MSKVQILMYHRVGNFPGRVKAHGALYCDLPKFRAQMRWLRILGYSVVGMDEAVAGLQGQGSLPPKPLVLTFDDAYVDFLENAAPVLMQHGYPATVYAVSDLLGRHSEWDAGLGPEPAPLMNVAQLREVQSMGFTIGSHSKSHVRLAQQIEERVASEMLDSKHRLQELLGVAVRHFCYPYGSHDLRCMDWAAKAGYTTATTCDRAAANANTDLMALPRKAVSRGDSVVGVWWKLQFKDEPKRPLLNRASTPRNE